MEETMVGKMELDDSIVKIVYSIIVATAVFCLLGWVLPTASLDIARDIATIVGTIGAVGALIKVVLDYAQSNAQKRAEHFVSMRVRFKNNKTFMQILTMLCDEDVRSQEELTRQDYRDFLGFFEEIALLVNSNLMQSNVAAYMFGWYAIKCWESEKFWEKGNLSKDDKYWVLFKKFVEDARQIPNSTRIEPSKFCL